MKSEKTKEAHEQCMYAVDIASLAAMSRQGDTKRILV